MLEIVAAGHTFRARYEEADAPATVAAFRAILPLEDRIIHCRWSGESNWIPWGDRQLGIGPELQFSRRTGVVRIVRRNRKIATGHTCATRHPTLLWRRVGNGGGLGAHGRRRDAEHAGDRHHQQAD